MVDTQEKFKNRALKLQTSARRQSVWTAEKVDEFLRFLEDGGTIDGASKKYGISVTSVHAYISRIKTTGKITVGE